MGSLAWLSRKPGRNIREKLKLSGKPDLLAVQRVMSNDTSENRLFKAFVLRFEEILNARLQVFPSREDPEADERMGQMGRWLQSDEAAEIGEWGNLLPNNTLLQHRDYRAIWDAWTRLQSLEFNLSRDRVRLVEDWMNLVYWLIFAHLDSSDYLEGSEPASSLIFPKRAIR